MSNIFHKKNTKALMVVFTLIFVVFAVCNIINNHVDIASVCFIDIKSEGFRGQRKTIKQALNLLKTREPETYRVVCEYVDVINEKRCIPGDPRGDPTYEVPEIEGCFIRGSHVIYIEPSKEISNEIVERRAEQIARYASYSKKYWK